MKKETAPNTVLYSAIFIFVLALAAVLRFYCLTCSSLWHDEGNAWALAQRGFARIAVDAAADIHPPGYYWLLKLWGGLFAFSAWGMRSLSALAGLLTVAVIYRLGLETGDRPRRGQVQLALFAALLAALNPFQVFYSQEARMYALLMLESAALIWALVAAKRRWQAGAGLGPVAACAILYLSAAASGLWTHYTFAAVLAAAWGAFAWWLVAAGRGGRSQQRSGLEGGPGRSLLRSPLLLFLVVNGLALVSFLPWLATAIERLLHWPAQNGYVSPLEGLRLILQTLAAGPIRSGPQLAWGWMLVAGLLPLVGLWRLRRSGAGATLLLWTLLPIGAMFVFGLFSPAFLKFLLVLSPAWCLLTAAAALPFPDLFATGRSASSSARDVTAAQTDAGRFDNLRRYAAPGAVAALGLALALAVLPGYYADPAARDNYADMARTVAALGDPERDLVILNAPGQTDVWRFYDPGVRVLPLPAERPPDRDRTEATLVNETAGRRNLFAVLWATEQSDSEGIVENWLGRNAFKGLESWQGNVRFATYTLSHDLYCVPLGHPPRFGDVADLAELCLSARQLAPGDTLQIGLRWLPLSAPERRLFVSVQLLDHRDQVVVQRDGEPGGGSRPTLGWLEGEIVHDNHGLPLPPGTPPGEYRLIVALYDAESGVRLTTAAGDSAQIARPALARPARPLPVSIIPMQRRSDREVGPLTLAGYDFYRKSFAHAPATALVPGDILQVTLYWQAPDPLPAAWPDDLRMRLLLGEQIVESPLAGGAHPTAQWRAGELVRALFDVPFDGSDPTLWLAVGDARVELGSVPQGR